MEAHIRFFATFVLGLSLGACGGAQKSAQAPSGGAPGAPGAGQPAQQQVATTAQGQQYAVSDAPTSGSGKARPAMNATAAQSYQAGLSAFQAGDLGGAKTQFSNAAKADPKAYQAYYSLAVVQERLGEQAAALSSYQKALDVVSDYEPAIAGYALLKAETGQLSEAESFLNKKRSQMPDSAAVLAALAEVKSMQKDSAQAQKLAQEALKKNPDYRPAMVTLARDHYRNRRLDLALYTLKAILDGYGQDNPPRDENNAQAILLRALIYKEQGRRRDAIEQFKKAVDLRPDLVEARLDLAKFMLEAGNAGEAVPLLEKALNYDANNLLVHLDLGDAYRLAGRPADAQKHLEWVITKDPKLAEAHYNLGLMYLFAKNMPGMTDMQLIDKAIAHFERYKEVRQRSGPGAGDDVDELLKRAKAKKSIMQAMAAQDQPPPPPPPPDESAGASGGTEPAGAGEQPAGGEAGGSSGALPPAE